MQQRIVVVDDNKDCADSLARLLTSMGHEVATAYDGLSAIELARTFRAEVVVLDLSLPGLDGHGVARRIRREPWGAGITLIASSGWGGDDDRRLSREAGFDHHLSKPMDFAELESVLAVLR